MRVLDFIVLVVSLPALLFSMDVSPVFSAHVASLEGSGIKTMVKEYIDANMPWHRENIRIQFLNRVQDITVQGEKISYGIRSGRDEAFIGDSTFTVQVYDDGTLLKEIPMRVRMEVAVDVVVSTKQLQRNSEIGEGDIKLVRKWFNQMPVNAVTQIEDAVGKRLYSNVMPHGEIRRNMLKSIATVKRGKVVKVMLESGPMTITTFGLSEEDGGHGDFIRVRNMSSNKTVFARVIDDSSVRVEY